MKPLIRRSLRYLTVALTLLLGGLILALFTSQYWLPRVLPSALQIAGVESTSIYRGDEGRIVIDELSYSSEAIAFTSKKMILPNLYQYVSASFIRKNRSAASQIEIEAIDIGIRQSDPSEKESQGVFPADGIRSFRSAYRNVFKKIPPISVKTLNISSSKLELTLNDFERIDTNLSFTLESDFLPQSITLNATLAPNTNWILHGAMNGTALAFDLSMKETSGGYLFSGRIHQPGEVIELNLELEHGEPLPKTLSLNSSGFTLDASLFSTWPSWHGGSIDLKSLQIDWDEGAYFGTLELSSDSTDFLKFSTPIEASVEIEGDSTTMKIQSLNLRSPLVETSLDQPVLLFLEDGIRVLSPVENAELNVLINLSQQPWVEAEGQLKARIQIPAGRSLASTVPNFKISGDNLSYAGQRVHSFQATGSFQNTTFILESGSMQTDPENNGKVAFHGQVNLLDKTLDLDYEIRLASEFINAFWENSMLADRLWIKGHVGGSWPRPKLNFDVLDATLAIPELNVIRLQGIGSVGDLTTFEWNGFAESDGAYIHSEIAGLIDTDAIHVEIANLALYDPEFPKLVLSEPVSIDFSLGENFVFDRLSVSDFEWNSVEEQFSGAYSPETGLSLGISNFSCARLNRWLSRPSPVHKIESLTASITAFDPFLEGELSAQVSLLLANGKIFSDRTLPVADSIKLRASANAEHLEISEFRASLNQSELEGTMMLPTDHLTDWLNSDAREVNDLLKTLTGDLTLSDWQMENWIELLPMDLFRRSGFLDGSLQVDKGLNLSGFLQFRDFGLRPTESFSSIDHISGDLFLENNRLELQSATAQVGGSDVAVNGWVDWKNMKDVFWDVKLSGENIPIIRTTEMILRSDIDLEAKHLEKSGKPLVQGRLDLQASTLLVEFDPLAPNTEFGPGSRPPFFSIEQKPINDWLFDVTVFGETFMRVRSPYFKTQLSADFHLGGSFQDPELIGRVTTTNGQLSFPGTKMIIDKGEAFIEPSSPDTVYLDFAGTAQTTLHVITMEVSNTLEEPYIQFHATPELPNTSIIQLLATGTTSDGGAASVGLYLGKGFLGPGSMNETLMDRLTIDFSKKRSRSGRQTFSARFDLNQDWSLSGEYDQYDAYNMNLIWHLLGK